MHNANEREAENKRTRLRPEKLQQLVQPTCLFNSAQTERNFKERLTNIEKACNLCQNIKTILKLL